MTPLDASSTPPKPSCAILQKSPVQFSHSVVSDFLWLHGLQHARLPRLSSTPGPYSNSCPLSRWCHPNMSSSVDSRLQIFPSIRIFSNESALRIRWPKYWSFSISPSNEYSGLISFRIDWLDSLQFKGLSRVFSKTIVQKRQFFGAQSLRSKSHIHIWLLEKP